MGGKASRDKGARSERALRDELLRQGWRDVRRVPLSGAVKTSLAYQDDVVGTAPDGKEYRFENKARATGFDAIYALVPPGVTLAFHDEKMNIITMSLDPNAILGAAQNQSLPFLGVFEKKTQRAMRSVIKKCDDWLGNAHILSLKQDRMPFLFIRYFR